MADETMVIDRWLYETLIADSAIIADTTIHQGSTFHVYEGVAPESINVSRWIIYQLQSSRDIVALGGNRILVDCLYIIKVITTGSGGGVKAVSDRIDFLFNNKHSVQSYVRIEECLRETPFRLNQTVGNITYRQRGGVYRIRAQMPL